MPTDDKTTFRFLANGRTAFAKSVGSEHVGVALSADGISVSLMMTVTEAKALKDALGAAIVVSESMVTRECVERVDPSFDAAGEAERVRQACGDGPRLPAEDGR